MKKLLKERLREKIENYSKYFNIENILEKQKNIFKIKKC